MTPASRSLRWAACLIAVVLSVALSACDTPPSRQGFPELTYQHLQPLSFDVARIEILPAYQSPGALPNVEHRFDVKPADAAANWARDRLRALGAQRVLRFIIKDASVVEEPLKIDEGLAGSLKVQQSERYVARMTIEAQIVNSTGLVEATAMAMAERSITVPEDITLHDRERVWFRLTENIMQDLNGQLEETLPSVFARYFRG